MQVNHLYGEQNRAFIVKNCLLPVCVGSDAATSAYIVLEPVPVLPETMIKAFQHFLQFLDKLCFLVCNKWSWMLYDTYVNVTWYWYTASFLHWIWMWFDPIFIGAPLVPALFSGSLTSGEHTWTKRSVYDKQNKWSVTDPNKSSVLQNVRFDQYGTNTTRWPLIKYTIMCS